MENEIIIERYKEEQKEIVSKLKALHNTILTLYSELESEQIEQQTLDVIDCIGMIVNDIINSIDMK